MHEGQDAVSRLAAIALGLLLPGCGAVFHASQQVEMVTRPEDKAVVYQSGAPLTAAKPNVYTQAVFLNTSTSAVAVAPGKKIARMAFTTSVDGVAILCDVLWSLTIIGIAAPISDGILGTFVKTDNPVNVQMEDDAPTDNPMPVYSVEGQSYPATSP